MLSHMLRLLQGFPYTYTLATSSNIEAGEQEQLCKAVLGVSRWSILSTGFWHLNDGPKIPLVLLDMTPEAKVHGHSVTLPRPWAEPTLFRRCCATQRQAARRAAGFNTSDCRQGKTSKLTALKANPNLIQKVN